MWHVSNLVWILGTCLITLGFMSMLESDSISGNFQFLYRKPCSYLVSYFSIFVPIPTILDGFLVIFLNSFSQLSIRVTFLFLCSQPHEMSVSQMEHIIAFSQLCCCENVSDRLRQTTVLNDSNIRYQDRIYMQQKLYYVIVYSMIHSENRH